MPDGPRLASLKAKLKAREGKSEYKVSNEDLKAEIARLERLRDLKDIDL